MGNDDLTLQAGNPTNNVPGPGPCVVGVTSDTSTTHFAGTGSPDLGTYDLIVAVALNFVSSGSTQFWIDTRVSNKGWAVYTWGLGN